MSNFVLVLGIGGGSLLLAGTAWWPVAAALLAAAIFYQYAQWKGKAIYPTSG